jgi:hypothetical protein
MARTWKGPAGGGADLRSAAAPMSGLRNAAAPVPARGPRFGEGGVPGSFRRTTRGCVKFRSEAMTGQVSPQTSQTARSPRSVRMPVGAGGSARPTDRRVKVVAARRWIPSRPTIRALALCGLCGDLRAWPSMWDLSAAGQEPDLRYEECNQVYRAMSPGPQRAVLCSPYRLTRRRPKRRCTGCRAGSPARSGSGLGSTWRPGASGASP